MPWLVYRHPRDCHSEEPCDEESASRSFVGALLAAPAPDAAGRSPLERGGSTPLSLLRETAPETRVLQTSRTSYWVTDDYSLIRRTLNLAPTEQKATIEEAGRRAIYSYNQTDFVKNRVAVEIQFGKYSFIAYDLFVKHLAFYVGHTIDVGVEILAMKSMQEHMSSGPGYYEGSLYDMARQGRGVPAVPLVLVGVSP